MAISPHLKELVDANAPYWGGEAEVARRYFESVERSKESDRIWLERQMYKEFWDGFVPPLQNKIYNYEKLEQGLSRNELLAAAELMYEELAHYCVFADVYEQIIEQGSAVPNPSLLKTSGQWTENVQLMQLRKQHKAEFGDLGVRAHAFTEGGYCTLYAEGMKLRGRGAIDDMIADACAAVYEDEFDHMLIGISQVGSGLTPEEWKVLTALTVEQMQYRIKMRNAQFGYPLDSEAERTLCAGACEPIPFNFERAGLA